MAKKRRSANRRSSKVTTRTQQKNRRYFNQAFKEAVLPVAMPLPHPKTIARRVKYKAKVLIKPSLFLHPSARKARILKVVLPGFAYRLWRAENAIRKECARRRIRREVLMAKGLGGTRRDKIPKIRPESRIKC